jgi:TRAP-type C4-dicarboxylate transport system substrate-binding protein
MIDVTMTSCVGVLAMQWYGKARYVSAQGRGFVNGALVMNRRTWEELPGDVQRALERLALKHSDRVQKWTRKLDRTTYHHLLARGVVPVEVDDLDEWERVGMKLRRSMVGRLYTDRLLLRVESIIDRYDNAAPAEETAPLRRASIRMTAR